MDFQLSADQRELIAGTERLCAQLLPLAKAAHAEGGDGLPRLRAAMAEAGLLGLNLPAEYGGSGLPLLDTLLVIQAIQKIDSTLGGLAHRTSTGAVGAVLELGNAAQREEFVGGVAKGRIGISIGITEPEAGSAATSMQTRARIDGDDVIVNGQKIFISAARDNHCTLLYCRFGTTGRAGDIGALLVPHDAPGVAISPGTVNMAGERQYELFFSDARVPRANVLAEGHAFGKLISVYNVERLGSVEISGVSQVRHPTKGLVWLTCIRSYPEGRLSTDYAIFIRDNKIVDARNSIVPDACAKQQYLPLIVIPPPRGRSTIY